MNNVYSQPPQWDEPLPSRSTQAESRQEAYDVWGPGQVAPLSPDEIIDTSVPEITPIDEVLADQLGVI